MMDWLFNQFQTNQFLTGASVAGIIAGTVALLRTRLIATWQWCVAYFTVSITIHSEDPSFAVWMDWVKNQRFDKFRRRYRLRSGLQLTPDYGRYCLWFGYRPVWISSTRDEKANPGPYGSAVPKEFLHISTLSATRTSAWLTNTIEDLRVKLEERSKAVVDVFKAQVGSVDWVTSIPKKPTPSVILPAGQLEALDADIELFLASEDVYARRGIPWRRGYLFHGVPGSGKTSVIRHIARKYAGAVYICDTRLARARCELPLFVFEDIDCQMSVRRDKVQIVQDTSIPTTPEEADRVGGFKESLLGDLLNDLDGLSSPTGAIIIMTTNHREKLDPALLRPGRIDYELEFTHATPDQVQTVAERFFPTIGPVAVPEAMSMATVQGILQRCRSAKDAELALCGPQ